MTGSIFLNTRRRTALLALPVLLLSLAGCAVAPPVPPTADELQWAQSGAGLVSDDSAPLERPETLLHVSDEMHAFAVKATGNSGIALDKIIALSHALNSESGLNIQYDAEATLSAEEAFRQRRANCLSYSLLFVALARSVGIEARFNEVLVPPIWDMGDDSTSVLYRHINVRTDLPGILSPVVDVSDDYDPRYPQGLVSDSSALAQFYNNRSVQLRLQQQPMQALRYEVRALLLAPRAGFLWNNLAELYLQQDQVHAARVAVEHALELDSGDMLTYDTAANVYERSGNRRLAASFRERAQDFRERNPYYHYQLALADLRHGEMSKAHEELTEAVQQYPSEARFHFLMALVLADMGQPAEAEHSLQTALSLSPTASQQERYKSKFARLAKQG